MGKGINKNPKGRNSIKRPEYRVNSEINGYQLVRITGEGIESRVVSLHEAKNIADDMGLDLIEINGKLDPPIMKSASYEKMMYEIKKAAKKQKKQQLKEIQLKANIAKNDLDVKSRKAREFIEDGDKVKVVLTMRGRELSRRDANKVVLYEFIDNLSDVSVPESMPKDEGNRTVVILKKKNKQ